MAYLVRIKRKVFSRSGDRMVEEYKNFEYEDREKAYLYADEQKNNPLTVSVRVFKEESNVK